MKDFYNMTRQEFTEFLDKQAIEKKDAICFDNWNKEGTYEYKLSQRIEVGENVYSWLISSHKMRGRAMAFTNPYIILNDITYQISPPCPSGNVSGFIQLDKFSLDGSGDLKRRHANRIIQQIRKDIVRKALKDKKEVPISIQLELELAEIDRYQINRTTSGLSPVVSDVFEVGEYASYKDARRHAECRAKKLSQAGYQGEITFQTKDEKWHFLKRFKSK